MSQIKQDNLLLLTTLPHVDRFSKFFHHRTCQRTHHTSYASLHYLVKREYQETCDNLKEVSCSTINFNLFLSQWIFTISSCSWMHVWRGLRRWSMTFWITLSSTPAHATLHQMLHIFIFYSGLVAELWPRLCSQLDWGQGCSAEESPREDIYCDAVDWWQELYPDCRQSSAWRSYMMCWGRHCWTLPHWPGIIAPCGLRGCKNGPAPFPGRMSYKATKPGLVFVLYLSMFIIVFGVY